MTVASFVDGRAGAALAAICLLITVGGALATGTTSRLRALRALPVAALLLLMTIVVVRFEELA